MVRFVAPWIGLGFAAGVILGLLLDVQGAIGAFALGAIAPALVYLPPYDSSLVSIALDMFRTTVPFAFNGLGNLALVELTMDWWIGAMFGAALAIYVRRARPA